MNRKLALGVLVVLLMSDVFVGVSFAADKAADANPAVTNEAKPSCC
jgi:hypothetical protein